MQKMSISKDIEDYLTNPLTMVHSSNRTILIS